MHALDVAAKEVRQVLASRRTSPEWRWNAHRRLAVATTAMIPTQQAPEDRGTGLGERLHLLSGDVLDRLDAGTIERELQGVLHDLERLRRAGARHGA